MILFKVIEPNYLFTLIIELLDLVHFDSEITEEYYYNLQNYEVINNYYNFMQVKTIKRLNSKIMVIFIINIAIKFRVY